MQRNTTAPGIEENCNSLEDRTQKCKAITGQLHKRWKLELFEYQMQPKAYNHAFDKNTNFTCYNSMGVGMDMCLLNAPHMSS